MNSSEAFNQCSIALRVGGFIPLTTNDFPGMLSAVVFCQGCPWHCRYCHNTHLIPSTADTLVSWDTILSFLKKRRGLLDAVVFSGGEPTMQPEIEDAIRQTYEEGLRVGLHTAGQYPGRLKKLIPYLSWVGFDIKAPFGHYEKITQRKSVLGDNNIQTSLSILLASGVAFECRTTVHQTLLNEEELLVMARDLSQRGVEKYVIQYFRKQGCTDANLLSSLSTHDILSHVGESELRDLFPHFVIRGTSAH